MAESESLAEAKQHIVMLPVMAHGHLIPFLRLALFLLRRCRPNNSFTVTIAATPLNARYLRSALHTSSSISDHLHISELPFNSSDHGLPPNVENTEAVPLNQIIRLFQAYTSLQPSFHSLVRDITLRDGAPPLCIISDVFVSWANEVAAAFQTVNVTFTTGGAYGTAAYASLWQHLPHRGAVGDYFSLPGFPESHRFHITHLHPFLRVADGTDDWSAFFQRQIGLSMNSFGWLCNTAEEIERLGLDVLKNYTNRPIWCIGPLLPNDIMNRTTTGPGQRTGKEFGISPEECRQWLDLQPRKSVVYISFGSQNTISPSQMMALAMGLEDSNRPFIWVIRPPTGFNLTESFKPEWLPEGFEERVTQTKKRGLLVKQWAPQVEILCHESTGVFMSHCGWNSTVEGLSQGVAMIGWPLAAEQGYNCKMLVEEMGVCVELTRGTQSEIRKEDVRRVIETAMEGQKAADMRKKAEGIGERIRAAVRESESEREEGSSCRAMDEFLATLLQRKKTNQPTVALQNV